MQTKRPRQRNRASTSLDEFMYWMKDKKFSQNLIRFLMDESVDDEIEIGKALSSYLTHAFIECQMSEDPIIILKLLKVPEVTNLLNEFIGGYLSVSELRKQVKIELSGESF